VTLDSRKVSTETWLVAGGRPVASGAPLNHPIVPVSTFEHGTERTYSRSDSTETCEALEKVLGGLEGANALAFASGMAAAAAVFDQVEAQSEVVIPDDCYQGVAQIAADGEAKGLWTVTRLDVGDTESWIAARSRARLVWVESPTNPLLKIADLVAIAAAPREPNGLLVVDNTFATSLNQLPLDIGAEISMQSSTKFVGGHSDLLGGVLATRDDELLGQLRKSRSLLGSFPGALETFLTLRGVRTMKLRLERSQANAEVLAERLAAHPAVGVTRYPGLRSHPGHELAASQLSGNGSMISFDLDSAEAGDRACARLGLIRHATSLGGIESSMERRALTVGQEHLPPGLLRLSVGCEDVEDLWADLSQAIA